MRVAIGVLARAPRGETCKPALLAAHEPRWVAGLYAAMLRDTLDGLLSVPADDYVVFAAHDDGDGDEGLLARHVPLPWRIARDAPDAPTDHGSRVARALAALLAGHDGTYAVVAASDAPSSPTEPLARALARAQPDVVRLGPSEDGGLYVLGAKAAPPRLLEGLPWGTPALVEGMRVRCKELALAVEELPTWYDIDRPSDVLTLLDELRRHPERAPRTAQYLVTAS